MRSGPGENLRITIRIGEREFQRGVVCHNDQHQEDVGRRSCDVSELSQVIRVTGCDAEREIHKSDRARTRFCMSAIVQFVFAYGQL